MLDLQADRLVALLALLNLQVNSNPIPFNFLPEIAVGEAVQLPLQKKNVYGGVGLGCGVGRGRGVTLGVGETVGEGVGVADGVGDTDGVGVGVGVGLGVTVGLGVGDGAPSARLNAPIRNRHPTELVVGTYSLMYQNVMSSLGSGTSAE